MLASLNMGSLDGQFAIESAIHSLSNVEWLRTGHSIEVILPIVFRAKMLTLRYPDLSFKTIFDYQNTPANTLRYIDVVFMSYFAIF